MQTTGFEEQYIKFDIDDLIEIKEAMIEIIKKHQTQGHEFNEVRYRSKSPTASRIGGGIFTPE